MKSFRRAFTLIELLVVIAIIAILAVVVILLINPQELLRQGRDSTRLSDLATLTHAISIYAEDLGGGTGYSLGNTSVVYVSLPDPTLSGAQTSTCSSLGLPALGAGTTYQCSSPQSVKNVDGTGWIPINFKNISSRSPIGNLPVDPSNQSSTGLYYAYSTNGSQFTITALPESQKQKNALLTNPMTSSYPKVMANGSAVTAATLYNPNGLVGWWPLNEGSGTVAYDKSSFGNNGGWNGTQAGTSGYYGPGKVGTYAGYFDGSTDYVNIPDNSSFDSGLGTWIFWVNPSTAPTTAVIGKVDSFGSSNGINIYINNTSGGTIGAQIKSGSTLATTGNVISLNQWHQFALVFSSGVSYAVYLDGNFLSSSTLGSFTFSTQPLRFAKSVDGFWVYFQGYLNDVRVYNRQLSSAEVLAIYNAEK